MISADIWLISQAQCGELFPVPHLMPMRAGRGRLCTEQSVCSLLMGSHSEQAHGAVLLYLLHPMSRFSFLFLLGHLEIPAICSPAASEDGALP